MRRRGGQRWAEEAAGSRRAPHRGITSAARLCPLLPAAAAGLVLLAHPLAAQTARRYTLTLRGAPDDSMVDVVHRTVTLANTHARARIIVRLAVDSAGWGLNRPAARIAGELERADGAVYALVDTAWGGAVLVALAADAVFMRPGGSLGAGPQESPAPGGAAGDSLHTRLARLLERHGADTALAAAMLPTPARAPGGPTPGALTLSAGGAVAAHLAAGVVADEPALVDRLHLGAARAMNAADEWAGVTIEIRNNNWQDLTFYVDRGAVRERLGLIPSMSVAEYDLGAGHFASGTQFRIVGEIVGSPDTVASEWISARPGLVIQWQIQNRLSFSTIFVHVRS